MAINNNDIINKIIGAFVSNYLVKQNDKGRIFYSTNNHAIGSSDCFFYTEPLLAMTGKEFTTKNGVCYSINYSGNQLRFKFVLSSKYLKNDELTTMLLNLFKKKPSEERVVLHDELIATITNSDESAIELELNSFINNSFESFETKLNEWWDSYQLFDEELYEGAPITVELTKYERNRTARLMCIKHYGAVCQICGFDFKKQYGEEFEGMIEVHHRVPLSEIKDNYEVDPVKDLIPVCPNCHAAIHSKKNGYYSIEEMKSIFRKTKGNS